MLRLRVHPFALFFLLAIPACSSSGEPGASAGDGGSGATSAVGGAASSAGGGGAGGGTGSASGGSGGSGGAAPAARVLTGDSGFPKSEWVYVDGSGKLAYKTLPKGERILDFSQAGYRGGGVAIPALPVKRTVAPSGGTTRRPSRRPSTPCRR